MTLPAAASPSRIEIFLISPASARTLALSRPPEMDSDPIPPPAAMTSPRMSAGSPAEPFMVTFPIPPAARSPPRVPLLIVTEPIDPYVLVIVPTMLPLFGSPDLSVRAIFPMDPVVTMSPTMFAPSESFRPPSEPRMVRLPTTVGAPNWNTPPRSPSRLRLLRSPLISRLAYSEPSTSILPAFPPTSRPVYRCTAPPPLGDLTDRLPKSPAIIIRCGDVLETSSGLVPSEV